MAQSIKYRRRKKSIKGIFLLAFIILLLKVLLYFLLENGLMLHFRLEQ